MNTPQETTSTEADPLEALPSPGTLLEGKYRVEGILGQGGMATVLAATHVQLDERVALKLLLPQWAQDPELVDRFMREGRAAIKIRSEHVVRVLDVGTFENKPFLVMEYLEGRDLDAMIATSGSMPFALAVDYLLQCCEAIAEAHASGIIHRDLKPANLFLTRRADGSACMKVLDFGISKVNVQGRVEPRTTQPTTILGSPHYMSPEQMQSSRAVDARSDVWALGAILHELIAGVPPYAGETITELCAKILQEAPPPLSSLRPEVPKGLEAAVLRCLEKDPSRRFADVAELAAAFAMWGSASAANSAERIARVLHAHDEGSESSKLPWSVPTTHPARVTPARGPDPNDAQAAVRVVASARARSSGRVAGYVAGATALVGVGCAIGWMIVRSHRAAEAAAMADAEAHASAPLATNATAVTNGTASAMPPAAAQPTTPSTLAPTASALTAKNAHAPTLPQARTPARHPRAGRSAEPPPLPDFPIPTAQAPASGPADPPPPPFAMPAPTPAAPH